MSFFDPVWVISCLSLTWILFVKTRVIICCFWTWIQSLVVRCTFSEIFSCICLYHILLRHLIFFLSTKLVLPALRFLLRINYKNANIKYWVKWLCVSQIQHTSTLFLENSPPSLISPPHSHPQPLSPNYFSNSPTSHLFNVHFDWFHCSVFYETRNIFHTHAHKNVTWLRVWNISVRLDFQPPAMVLHCPLTSFARASLTQLKVSECNLGRRGNFMCEYHWHAQAPLSFSGPMLFTHAVVSILCVWIPVWLKTKDIIKV